MDPLLNSNSMLNNLVRDKFNQQQQQQQQQQQMNANVGVHGRVESVDSGLDGMGIVDSMGSMEDVDMEGNQPLSSQSQFNNNNNNNNNNNKDGGQLGNRLPEFFDSMQ